MPVIDPAFDPMRKHLGMRLRALREFAGLNLREFARYMGVSYQAVQTWESGGASWHVAMFPRMAQILQCSIEAFYDTEINGRPTRPARAADRLMLDAVTALTPHQRDMLIQFLRAMTTAEEPVQDETVPRKAVSERSEDKATRAR